ncbi:MAG: polysaccharide biosynthesis tyrosine autokinase [Thermomicrobiaceae bacterium]
MTLPEILKAIRQWWWILLICPIIAAGTAYFVSSSMTPIYEAETTAIVEHQIATGAADLQSIQAAERRTQTFAQLVTSRSVLERVVEDLGLEGGVENLRGNVSVSNAAETQLVSVAVQDEDPEHAAEIANATVEHFSEYVREIQTSMLDGSDGDLAQSLDEVQAQIADAESRIQDLEDSSALTQAEQDQLESYESLLTQLQQTEDVLGSIDETFVETGQSVGSQVFVVESAAAPTGPVSPRIMLNTALAGILGLLLGGGLVVGVAWLDDNVKTEEDVRRILDRPLIGTVAQERRPVQLESMNSEQSINGEIFRGLRTNLQFTMVDRDVRSIVVTSAGPGEGKTTIATNLAIVLAQGGQRVVLVDADLRRPRVHNLFHGVRNDRGLSNMLLESSANLEDMVQRTKISRLWVLATGPLPPNPPDLLGSARMKALVNALEESVDIVIFDSPPLAISESLLLSSLADGILMVVRSGRNRRGELSHAYELALQAGAPILGVVLNGVSRDSQATRRVYQQYYSQLSGDDQPPSPPRRSGWLGRVFGRST